MWDRSQLVGLNISLRSIVKASYARHCRNTNVGGNAWFKMKIALTLGFVVAFTQASGCTCNENVKEKDLIERADYAFIGEVISNVYLDSDSLTALLLQKRSVRPDAILKVTKIIKGRLLKEEVIVITSGSSCSMALIPGNQYLITGWTDSEKSKSSKIPESTKAKVDDMILYSNACYSRLKN